MKCKSGKKRYRTSVDAMLALVRIQNQRPIDELDRYEKNWYPCECCDGFHLTSGYVLSEVVA
jgi:L-rhamnose isomerase